MIDLYPLIKESFEQGLDFVFLSKGSSMLPLIKDKDSVTLEKSNVYKKNDIVLYRRKNGDFILHRIYKVKKDIYYLLGDHQINVEYPIYENQLIGKVKCYTHNGKKHELKGFKYRIYCIIWRNLFLRKVLLKIII